MGLHHRKLVFDSISSQLEDWCSKCNLSSICPPPCWAKCPQSCVDVEIIYNPPPSPPVIYDDHPNNHKALMLIIPLSIIAATFLVGCCYAIYARFFSGTHSSRRGSQPQTEENHDEFLDEDHGPMLDHPIWYIRTVGLQQSIISSITVLKYKKDEGVIEGTDCSICLSEFEEDETVRLLPKCSHAFHPPCIDTWLRSHTNCPMCRAPIVVNVVRTPSPESSVVNSGSGEETQMEIQEYSGGFNREIEDMGRELRIGAGEEGILPIENGIERCESSVEQVEGIQPRRRSVSLDSLCAAKINLALANIFPVGSDRILNYQSSEVNESNTGVVSKGVVNGNLSKLKGCSSRTRIMQNTPISMKRSFSFNGKHLFSRNSCSQKSSVPTRSF